MLRILLLSDSYLRISHKISGDTVWIYENHWTSREYWYDIWIYIYMPYGSKQPPEKVLNPPVIIPQVLRSYLDGDGIYDVIYLILTCTEITDCSSKLPLFLDRRHLRPPESCMGLRCESSHCSAPHADTAVSEEKWEEKWQYNKW